MRVRKSKRPIKDIVFRFRISAADFEAFQTAAEASGLTLSEWVRLRCNGSVIEAIPPSKVA